MLINGEFVDTSALEPRRVRMWKAVEGKCYWCGVITELLGKLNPKKATIDHVMPRYKGGGNDDANLVLACAQCNNRRNHEDMLGLSEGELLGKYVLRISGTSTVGAQRLNPLGAKQKGKAMEATSLIESYRSQRDNAIAEIRKLRTEVAETAKDRDLHKMLHKNALNRLHEMTFLDWVKGMIWRWMISSDTKDDQKE